MHRDLLLFEQIKKTTSGKEQKQTIDFTRTPLLSIFS